MQYESLRIGFVSTRLAGTDGVSLETAKWAHVLQEMGHECYYFAGELDLAPERCRLVPEAHFEHPLVVQINRDLFDDYQRTSATSDAVRDLVRLLKESLKQFVRDFGLQLLIIENALSIPMNVPLGLAITEWVAESDMPTIAHHHDFAWERTRFAVGAAEDYLQAAFPPEMARIHHVVINSYAAKQVALRTGMRSMLVPNVMDFENPPPQADDYSATLRRDMGLADGEVLLLQPTRVVPRKRIERAIELARWLDLPCVLVVSHSAGDEGHEYQQYLEYYAQALGVRTVFGEQRLAHGRKFASDGNKTYSLADGYQRADIVTYPSQIEGFGNAFLEAVYFRQPLLMSTYEIFKTDIHPKGFQVVGFDEFITQKTIEQARLVLSDEKVRRGIVDRNYELGARYYSYGVLRKRLSLLVEHAMEEMF